MAYEQQMSLLRVLSEITGERARQDVKWGEQNHPDFTGPHRVFLRAIAPAAGQLDYDALRHLTRAACQHAGDIDGDGWDLILLEEVFEALAEGDPEKLRAELIQVAAVAVNWIESIDRRDEPAYSAREHISEPASGIICEGTYLDDVH
jgi:hypothetical protein